MGSMQKRKCEQFKIGRSFHGRCSDPCGRCGCSAKCHGLDMQHIGYLELTWQLLCSELRAQWEDADFVPVVFNSKESSQSTHIEWKVFIVVGGYCVILSIRYNKNRRQWQLQTVVDCDSDRLWSQYLLLGPQSTKGRIGGEWRFWTEEDFKNRRKCIVKAINRRRGNSKYSIK